MNLKINGLVLVPVALVVGGLIGSWGPSEKLRAYKAQAAAEKAEAAKKPVSAAGFDSFANIVNIPKEARRRRNGERGTGSGERGTGDGVHGTPDQPTNEVSSAEAPKRERRKFNPEDLKARIEEASDLWRTRTEMKRAATIEKFGLDEKGAAAFDQAVSDMNAKLRESMQAMADELDAVEQMTPELGVRLMGDLSATVAEAYDSVGAVVGEGQRGEVSNLQLVEFVDPSVAEPLIAVQGKLQR